MFFREKSKETCNKIWTVQFWGKDVYFLKGLFVLNKEPNPNFFPDPKVNLKKNMKYPKFQNFKKVYQP